MREDTRPAAGSGPGHDPPAGELPFLHIPADAGRPTTVWQRLYALLLAWGRWMDGRSHPERERSG
jgi:hypothetical protein